MTMAAIAIQNQARLLGKALIQVVRVYQGPQKAHRPLFCRTEPIFRIFAAGAESVDAEGFDGG
jgi:hypothetical protein